MFETLFKYPLEMFLSGKLRLGSGLRVELALLAVAAAVAGAVYFYRRSPVALKKPTRIALSALRGLVLGLIVIVLFHPVLRIPRHQKRDSFLAVLVDDSRSMRIEDIEVRAPGDEGPRRISRLALARKVLGAPDEDGLWRRLAAICPVQTYGFSSSVKPIRSAAELRGPGERTDLYSALSEVDAELRGVPVAGIVVLTDGAVNAGGPPRDVAEELREKKRPVYCVGFGDPVPPADYEVLRIRAPRRVRSNASVEIVANIRINNFDDPFDVVLRQGKDVLQELQGVVPEPGGQIHSVRLGFRPEKKGTFTYTVEVPPHPGEVIRDNNRRDFLVEVIDDRLPVLYLEGSPRTEYRFIRRAMLRDKDFRIASILRLDGPMKFIAQGAEAEDGLEDGYPKSLEHLGRFQAVIFGDIDADFLTAEQLRITEEFVKRRGGGFLMLGGVNSFNLGKYQGTPIADMLPVILPAASVGYRHIEFNVRLTKTGEGHSIMRQSPNVVLNRDIWSKAPTLVGYNPIPQTKPLAQVLAAEVKTGAPILGIQNYGAGKTAAFVTGGSWHWRMAVPLENELHEKFWKQLIRWLAVGSKAKLTLKLNKDLYSLAEPVTIRAVLLDREFQPVNDAEIEVQITDPFGEKLKGPSGKAEPMRVSWTLSEPGVYAVQYEPPDAGEYTVTATARLKNSSEPAPTASAAFSVGETLDEYSDAGQKESLLREIAAISGGRYFQPQETNELCEIIEQSIGEMMRKETVYDQHDIWDTPLWFALMVVALSAEWVIRRRASLV
ncbi:MAG: glutamine amidotransferase [Phycisphaerae bacterium]